MPMSLRISFVVVTLALFRSAFSFKGTVPLLAWSSFPFNSLDALSSEVVPSSEILERIILDDDICSFDAILLISQIELHASDLRTLPRTSAMTNLFYNSPSNRQLEFLTYSSMDYSLPIVAERLAARCGASHLTPQNLDELNLHQVLTKKVISLDLPSLEDAGGKYRRDQMRLHTTQLVDCLSTLSISSPKYLVVYVGTPSATTTHERRRSSGSLQPMFDFGTGMVYDPTPTPVSPSGGVLARYQLFSSAVLMSLFVSLCIILPTLIVGFRALANIQSPMKLQALKPFSAAEKKNQ